MQFAQTTPIYPLKKNVQKSKKSMTYKLLKYNTKSRNTIFYQSVENTEETRYMRSLETMPTQLLLLNSRQVKKLILTIIFAYLDFHSMMDPPPRPFFSGCCRCPVQCKFGLHCCRIAASLCINNNSHSTLFL